MDTLFFIYNFADMNFRTEINIDPFKDSISYSDSVLTIGSCFADNIARYMSERKYRVLANPFGVLYNPVSVYNSLRILEDSKLFNEKDLIENQSEWHSFYHHSDFSHHIKAQCLSGINKAIKNAAKFLQETDWAIITYGTSYVYRWKETGEVVSNCHKIPQSKFDRTILSVEKLNETLNSTVKLLQESNPELKILFTVSPIRHWKDGAVDNQVSKAHLIVAINEIVTQNENCFYFPSYEIMMDDLRDYRFYSKDLLHPNEIAIDYIWQKFKRAVINPSDLSLIKMIEQLNSAKNHRIRNPYSEENKAFVRKQLEIIRQIIAKNPQINLAAEQKYFESFEC